MCAWHRRCIAAVWRPQANFQRRDQTVAELVAILKQIQLQPSMRLSIQECGLRRRHATKLTHVTTHQYRHEVQTRIAEICQASNLTNYLFHWEIIRQV